jgi:hypothetical protein
MESGVYFSTVSSCNILGDPLSVKRHLNPEELQIKRRHHQKLRQQLCREKKKLKKVHDNVPAQFHYHLKKPYQNLRLTLKKKWEIYTTCRKSTARNPRSPGGLINSTNFEVPIENQKIVLQGFQTFFKATNVHVFANEQEFLNTPLAGTGLSSWEELKQLGTGYTEANFALGHVYKFLPVLWKD